MKIILHKKTSLLILYGMLVGLLGYGQNFPDTLPKLPQGKSVTISYQVAVDRMLPVEVTQVSEQDSISFIDPNDFLARIWELSDDPSTVAGADATLSAVEACQLEVSNCNDLTDPNYNFLDVPSTAAERFADAGGTLNTAGDMPAPCGNVTITDDFVNPGECGGQALVTFTIVDDRNTPEETDNDTLMCNVMITVHDDEPPTFTCPLAMNVNTTGNGNCEVIIPDFANLVTDESDNCDLGTSLLEQSIPAGAYQTNGHATSMMVDLSLEDAAGNRKDDCQVTLTVVDNEPPTAMCPPSITVDNGKGQCGAVVSFTIPDATDNCDNDVSVSSSIPSGSSFYPIGSTEVRVTARDNADQTDQCFFNVVVNDTEPPTFTCPEPMNVSTTGNGTCEVVIPDFSSLVTDEADNCTLGGNSLQQSVPAGLYPSLGHGSEIRVDLNLMDARNNTDTVNCTVVLSVVDLDPPIARCQEATVVVSPTTGEAMLLPGDIDQGSTDNCAIGSYLLDQRSSITYTCADIGAHTVMLSVIDEADLTNSCEARVNVLASSFCPQPVIENEEGPSIADPCTCSATPGYFDEEVVITGNNPGEAWRLQSVNGYVDPNDFPNEFSPGDLFTDNGDGTYSLVGMHESGIGYQVSAVSDFYPGIELMIGNTCYLPILANADTSICSNEYLGIVLDNVPPSMQADSFYISAIDLGDAVQLNGLTANMGSSAPDLLADMVFEYEGPGSTTVQITVLPFNEDGCQGDPLLITVNVQYCTIACADNININLPEDCSFPLDITNVTSGQDIVTRFGYFVLVNDGVYNGHIIDGTGTFTYGVFNRQEEIKCWGTVTTLDKRPPLITPPADIPNLECWLVDEVYNNPGTVAPFGDGAGGDDDGADGNHLNDLGVPTVIDGCEGELPYTFHDIIQYYTCDPGGVYAEITRTFKARDSEGNSSSATQTITFRTVDYSSFAFEPDDDDSDGQTFELVNGRWVLTVQTCSAGEVEAPQIYPVHQDAFGNKVSLADNNCNVSIGSRKITFNNICEDGYKEERYYNYLDWCQSTFTPVFPYSVKVGDFEAPLPVAQSCIQLLVDSLSSPYEIADSLNANAIDESQICGVISTIPNDCTGVLDISLSGLENQFGDLLQDCKAIEISVDVLSFRPETIGNIIIGPSRWETANYYRQGDRVWGLPEGKHALFISASDPCYNSNRFLLFFEVRDQIKPIMKCDDELRVTLVEGDGMLGVNGYALIAYQNVDEGSSDNCELVNLEIRRNFLNDETGQARTDWLAKNDPDGNDLLTDKFGDEEEGDDYTPWADIVEFFCADVTELGLDQGGVQVELRGTDRQGNSSICWTNVKVENGTNFGVELIGDNQKIACTDLPVNREDINEDYLNNLGIFASITGNGGCQVGEAGLSVDLSGLNQCGLGRIVVRIDPNSVSQIETKNPVTVSDREVYLEVVGDYNYWVKFPKDESYLCTNESAQGVAFESFGCGLITVYQEDERFASIADPNACYKILRTYKVINWCEYDGESQPVIVSRDWDAHNASGCSTNRNGNLEGAAPDVKDAGEYNLNPLEPRGDGLPGDEDIYVIVDVNNVFPTSQDLNQDGAIQAQDGELVIVYYDNNENPYDNSTADQYGDNDVSGPLSSYAWSGNPQFGTYRDQSSSRNDEGYWWAVVRGETSCTSNESAWYDNDDDPSHPDINGNNGADDSDNRYGSFGFWQYTQHIIVYDDTNPEASLTIDDSTLCSLDGINCDANVTFTVQVSDLCSTDYIKVTYSVDGTGQGAVANNGDGTFTATYNDASIGSHILVVTIKDGCGNEVNLVESFEVKDCKAPAPICHEDIIVELMPVEGELGTAMAEVWATDFIASDIADCSGQGPDLINGLPMVTSYSINRLDSAHKRDQIGLVFGCEEENEVIMVEIHAWDTVGNHDFCVTSVLVQDNNEICNPGSASGIIAGAISTETASPIEGVEVDLSGNTSRTFMTDANGNFGFEQLENGYDYSVIPSKNEEHQNGVSTFDMVLIQKHILGNVLLNSPYKIIAADVNNSGSVSTLDLIQIRKLILDIEKSFLYNSSWRFVKADYTFPDPKNPWSQPFPEVKNINNLRRSDYANFVGVKIGDVNNSAKAYETQVVDPRSARGVLEILTEDIAMSAGETYTISFRADLDQVAGYQFTLEWDPAYAQLVELEEGLAKSENFGVFAESGIITTSFHRKGAELPPGKLLFSLRMQSKKAVSLKDLIRLSSRRTRAEAYNVKDEDLEVRLVMGEKPVGVAYALHQNTPNPFDTETKIGFYLPQSGSGQLEIKDVAGKRILFKDGEFEQGYNEIRLRAEELPSAGVYFYTLHAGQFSATRKMILIQ